MPLGKNAWLTILTFDLLVKELDLTILHALLAAGHNDCNDEHSSSVCVLITLFLKHGINL